jgi:hypothetical protein
MPFAVSRAWLWGLDDYDRWCHGHVEDEEEVVDFGRPDRRRWLRVGALILAGLAVLALLAVRVWPRSGPTQHVSVPSATPSVVEESPKRPPATPTTKPWPTAPAACGSDAYLSIVSSTPAAEPTGIRLLLGGDRLRMVDFDERRTVTLTGLRPGEYAAVLGGSVGTYATTTTCEAVRSRVLRIGADRRISVIGSLAQTEAALTRGDRAWIVSYPDDADHPYGAAMPLGGGPRVRLPAGFYPYGAVGNTLVGMLQPDPSAPPVDLLLVDTATGRVRARLGPATLPIAAANGQVVWSSGCDPTNDRPCSLHRRSVATGATTNYRLPRPPCCGASIISADEKLLAFLLERATTDPRYEGHPIPPSDIAVMHLDTGRLEIVPGIEIPTKISPGLAFSADGRWLAIALNAGDRTRLLAWRSGLRHPYETTAIPGQVLGSPTLVVP